MVERKLKQLFDFQRFERNNRIEKMLQEAESHLSNELDDSQLELVNAAGDVIMEQMLEQQRKQDFNK